MPQDRSDDQRRGRNRGRTAWTRALLGVALAALLIGVNTAPVRAGDDDDDEPSTYDKVMRALGFKNPGAMEYGINYSERSPLVVPPTRD